MTSAVCSIPRAAGKPSTEQGQQCTECPSGVYHAHALAHTPTIFVGTLHINALHVMTWPGTVEHGMA